MPFRGLKAGFGALRTPSSMEVLPLRLFRVDLGPGQLEGVDKARSRPLTPSRLRIARTWPAVFAAELQNEQEIR